MKFWHRITHLFGWNTGRVVSWWDDTRLMIGFRCDGCGDIQGVHEGRVHIFTATTNEVCK